MRNPFEDKRKNDRINRLAKENEELKAEVELLQVQLSDLTTLNSLYESCIKKLENDLKKEKQTVFIKRYPSKGEFPTRTHKYKRELFFTNKGYSTYEYETKKFNKEEVDWFYQPISLDEISHRAEKYFHNQTLDEHRVQDMWFGANFILNHLKSKTNEKL